MNTLPTVSYTHLDVYKRQGSVIELNGRAYTVMAVVYPLTTVTEGAPEAAAADRLELEFILPLDAFRQQWPDSTLRKLFLNVDDEHIPEVQSFLDDYRETTDSSLPITSRQTMAEQYEAETRSSSVMGNAVSVVIAPVSYTHLDVYKRQVLSWRTRSWKCRLQYSTQ